MIYPKAPVTASLGYRAFDLIDKGNAELTFEARKPYFDEYRGKGCRKKAAMGYLYTKNLLTAY